MCIWADMAVGHSTHQWGRYDTQVFLAEIKYKSRTDMQYHISDESTYEVKKPNKAWVVSSDNDRVSGNMTTLTLGCKRLICCHLII